MKKNFTLIFVLLLCFFSIGASAQSQFWSDTFEDAGAPSTGVRTYSIPEFSNGVPFASYFIRTTPAQLALQNGAYSGFQGVKIFAAEDIDKGPTNSNNSILANQQVTWNNINIAGKTGLSFKGLFAADNQGGWQGSAWNSQSVSGVTQPQQDFLAFEYQIDGGPWVRAIAFYANLDPSNAGSANTLQLETTGDLQGDGASLTYAFAEYSANILGTGTTLNIRMNCHANSTGTQEVAVDNFRLFETLGSAATVTTGGNTPSYTTASLAGTVNDNNSTTAVTFEYGLTTAYGSSVSGTPSSVTAGTGSTAITGSLTSLLPNTTYHYRIKGINGIGTSNGTDGTFTTLSLPTVTTAVPGTITTTSAVLGGNVTAAGSSAVTDRGIVYSLTTNPTVANTKVQNGTGIGVFSATVSSFASNTLYYVKAYAINGGGPSYGAEQTFTTASSTITAGSTFPAGLTTTYGVTSSSTSIAVSGTNISAGITATPSSTANFEVSADDITYGPSATIGSSGTVSGTVYVRLKSTAAANAAITGSVTLTSTGSNSPVITIPTSSVAKATLTYTADLKSKIYGAAIPTLTGTVSGFVNSETVAVTTGTLSFTTSATISSSVGSFAINGTGLTAVNYSFVQAAGNATALTITPKTLTVTASGNNKAYDGTTAATVTLSDNRITG
ncbi:MBG domain-containing protein, partial [Pedobacter miscanthi]|uniref:MBG domain-containing protein n=1 Tax=Pedobacter miscanthi TaxID=2259170 RepID=UPI002930E5C8